MTTLPDNPAIERVGSFILTGFKFKLKEFIDNELESLIEAKKRELIKDFIEEFEVTMNSNLSFMTEEIEHTVKVLLKEDPK